jgi:bifunctional non-homologous end joining protein LigD
MALETYRDRRNFASSSEPKGDLAQTTANSFVVQKHAARRLHYDFRLEMDGVLKSWAVTRGPSLVPGEKRLAVHVEDHPVEYGDFEGLIPKGEYGGGSVIIWDRGVWIPLGNPHKGYAKGNLEFELQGEKLKGRWHLIRMKSKPREKHENWLLIKGEDGAARSQEEPDILIERPDSVKTGRDIDELTDNERHWPPTVKKSGSKASVSDESRIGDQLDLSRVKGARQAPMPSFVPPALATAVASPPSGENWIHEIKFDGYRLQARVNAGRVTLLTRSGLDWTSKFGNELILALQNLPIGSALIDGELVVEASSGASDFSALQSDLSAGRSDRFLFYAFDLLFLGGYDLQASSQILRKQLLEAIVDRRSAKIRCSEHFTESGALVLRHACRLGLEGVISKRADARYTTGRSKVWVKAKCIARQEFVVGGYVPSTTSVKAIGSLLLGVYEDDNLRFVGRVGTGFTASVAQGLYRKLDPARVGKTPFGEGFNAEDGRRARFVRPEHVAEVEFRAWTADGRLRHASFLGLREDKPVCEIVREPFQTLGPAPKLRRSNVQLTHPDRIYWPDAGVTKQGLADYYSEVWSFASPFLTRRPLALVRCPEGIEGEKFFQKHAWKGANEEIKLVRDPREPKQDPLITIEDLDGLIALVQGAALEIHPWGSTIESWERPDMIIMDLDPGEDTSWEQVLAAAEETRTRLKDAGLAAFVKTSGGKGLHVVTPLKPKAEWPAVKAFTKAIADAMAFDTPHLYVSTVTKSKRRGKILVDYLRNQRGATAVAPYSTRARAGAPVSMPLSWDELGPAIGATHFTVANAAKRLGARVCDPWEGFRAAAVPLEVKRRRKKSV